MSYHIMLTRQISDSRGRKQTLIQVMDVDGNMFVHILNKSCYHIFEYNYLIVVRGCSSLVRKHPFGLVLLYHLPFDSRCIGMF